MTLIREVAINKISFDDDDNDDETGWLKLYKNWIWLELFKKKKKEHHGINCITRQKESKEFVLDQLIPSPL